MNEWKNVPNIGRVLAEDLRKAGIGSREELIALGSKSAWLRMKAFCPEACISRLYALEGAVRGTPRRALPEAAKIELLAFFHAQKS